MSKQGEIESGIRVIDELIKKYDHSPDDIEALRAKLLSSIETAPDFAILFFARQLCAVGKVIVALT